MQDLGRDAGQCGGAVRQLRDRLLDFLARRKHRTTVSDEFVASRTDTTQAGRRVLRPVVSLDAGGRSGHGGGGLAEP
jgi:hypothetical protein